MQGAAQGDRCQICLFEVGVQYFERLEYKYMLSLEVLLLRADLVRTFRDRLQIPHVRSRTPVGSAAAEQRYKKRLELFADPHHLSNRTPSRKRTTQNFQLS